jgi:hypothetical protein
LAPRTIQDAQARKRRSRLPGDVAVGDLTNGLANIGDEPRGDEGVNYIVSDLDPPAIDD